MQKYAPPALSDIAKEDKIVVALVCVGVGVIHTLSYTSLSGQEWLPLDTSKHSLPTRTVLPVHGEAEGRCRKTPNRRYWYYRQFIPVVSGRAVISTGRVSVWSGL